MSKQDENSQLTIGSRLRELTEAMSVSLKEFAEFVDIPYGTLQQYVADKRKPGADQLAKFAEKGINLEWLLLGEQSAHLTFRFPSWTETLRGPVLVDGVFSRLVMDEAMSAVSAWHEEHLAAGGQPQPLSVLLVGLWSVFVNYSRAFEMQADRIKQLRAAGWPSEKIAGMLIEALRHFIRERLEALPEKPSTDAPQPAGT